jgi:hypothetical protein
MMYPDVDDLLASVIDTFERYIAPHVDDEYAASLSLTVTELLRSVRVRVALEGETLADDNAELVDLLTDLRSHVPPAVITLVDDALAAPVDGYPSVARLQRKAEGLRGALVAAIESLPDPDHPGRLAARAYLTNHLRRQEPWLVQAFVGPRR